jgi:hypothetical protein
MEATTSYQQPWTYNVTATVEFVDYPSETAHLTIKVVNE